MRGLVLGLISCCWLVAAPGVQASEYWQGKSVEQVREVFGEPNKVRPDKKGGKILSYKILLGSGQKSATGTMWIVGGQLEDAPPAEVQMWAAQVPTTGVGPEVRGKLKAKFYINGEGYVYLADMKPVKWKGKHE